MTFKASATESYSSMIFTIIPSSRKNVFDFLKELHLNVDIQRPYLASHFSLLILALERFCEPVSVLEKLLKGHDLFDCLRPSSATSNSIERNLTDNGADCLGKHFKDLWLLRDLSCPIENYSWALVDDYYCQIVYRTYCFLAGGRHLKSTSNSLMCVAGIFWINAPPRREECNNGICNKISKRHPSRYKWSTGLPRNWSVILWGAEQAAYFHPKPRAIVDQALWALELFFTSHKHSSHRWPFPQPFLFVAPYAPVCSTKYHLSGLGVLYSLTSNRNVDLECDENVMAAGCLAVFQGEFCPFENASQSPIEQHRAASSKISPSSFFLRPRVESGASKRWRLKSKPPPKLFLLRLLPLSS